MTKSLIRPESDADLLLQQAVDTLVNRYQQTKTANDGFDGMTRDRAVKIVVRRALALNQKGSLAKGAAATSILPPTN